MIGSIPTSIWTGRILKGIDIREHGSGNAGATNVYRVMGIKVALFVAIVDISKGIVSILIAKKIGSGGDLYEVSLIVGGLSAIFGHIYTIFEKFKGGKGVLVALGVFAILTPLASLSSFLLWIILVAIKKYVSLGSIVAAVMLPVFTYLYDYIELYNTGKTVLVFTVVTSLLVVFSHRANIKRLINGTENKIGSKKEK